MCTAEWQRTVGHKHYFRLLIQIIKPKVVAEWSAFLFRIWVVPNYKLGPVTEDFCDLLHSIYS
jgi:hypothetical protein